MPIYVYEAKDPAKGCAKCREGFEIRQSLSEARLEKCPNCQAPGLTHSQTDLHYRAKRAGFHTLKRVDKGTYEKMY